jgi:hypothetical protein
VTEDAVAHLPLAASGTDPTLNTVITAAGAVVITERAKIDLLHTEVALIIGIEHEYNSRDTGKRLTRECLQDGDLVACKLDAAARERSDQERQPDEKERILAHSRSL